MNHGQPELIRSAMEKLPPGSEVILAFDYDEGGEALTEEVTALAPSSVGVRRVLPPVGMGKDWNEVLKLQKGIVDPVCAPTVGSEFGKTPPASTVAPPRKPRWPRPKNKR